MIFIGLLIHIFLGAFILFIVLPIIWFAIVSFGEDVREDETQPYYANPFEDLPPPPDK